MIRLAFFASCLAMVFGCTSSEQRYGGGSSGTGSSGSGTGPGTSTRSTGSSSTGSSSTGSETRSQGSSGGYDSRSSQGSSGSYGSTGGSSDLAGTRWNVTLTPQNSSSAGSQARPSQETLIFEGNQVRLGDGQKHGFSPAPLTRQGGNSFQAELTSPEEGTMTWKGNLQGDTLRGTAVWKRKDGTTENYTFEGRKSSS